MTFIQHAAFLVLSMLLLSAPARGAETPPDELIRVTTARMFEAMKQDRERIKADPAYAGRLADRIVLPHADFQRMSRWVLGRNWRTASPAQRDRFVAEFRKMLVRTYSTAMSEFLDDILAHEQAVSVKGLDLEPDSRKVVVRSEIRRNDGGRPVPVHYRMFRNKQGEWKVYDVTVEGVSLVTNYRSTFDRRIHEQGLDALLDEMARNNARPLDGSVNDSQVSSTGAGGGR
jgi:phospholipid transport system substrate-binding protein